MLIKQARSRWRRRAFNQGSPRRRFSGTSCKCAARQNLKTAGDMRQARFPIPSGHGHLGITSRWRLIEETEMMCMKDTRDCVLPTTTTEELSTDLVAQSRQVPCEFSLVRQLVRLRICAGITRGFNGFGPSLCVVALCPRNDVEVDVGHFLPGFLAVVDQYLCFPPLVNVCTLNTHRKTNGERRTL